MSPDFVSSIDLLPLYFKEQAMKLNVNAITLSYTKQGVGKNILLLHGNGEDHHIFDKLSKTLAKDYTLYALDSRNHGESSKTNDYSYSSMAKDVQCFIEELGLEDVSLVGFSDGAIIGLTLVLDNDKIFDKMVLLGVNLKPTDFKEGNLAWLTQEFNKTGDPLLKLMLEQPNIEFKALQNITTPTLVVAADDDLFKPELYEQIVKEMPNAELLIMTDHQHDSYVVDQDLLAPQLKAFIQ